MRVFLKKGSTIFLPLLSLNFMPSFGKILGAVTEINCVKEGRTDERKDKDYIIEPVTFTGSTSTILFLTKNMILLLFEK